MRGGGSDGRRGHPGSQGSHRVEHQPAVHRRAEAGSRVLGSELVQGKSKTIKISFTSCYHLFEKKKKREILVLILVEAETEQKSRVILYDPIIFDFQKSKTIISISLSFSWNMLENLPSQWREFFLGGKCAFAQFQAFFCQILSRTTQIYVLLLNVPSAKNT